MSAQVILAPSRPNSSAVALPIPEAAPVMRVALSLSCIVIPSSRYAVAGTEARNSTALSVASSGFSQKNMWATPAMICTRAPGDRSQDIAR